MFRCRKTFVGILSLMGALLLVAAAASAQTDGDIQASRRAAEEALRQAQAVGADQWTHTDMVLAEESYRIGNFPLARERADTAREKTLALKNLAGLSSRVTILETSTANLAKIESTANAALAAAQRAEANSLAALEQARLAEKMAKEVSERTTTVTSSTTTAGPSGPVLAQQTALQDVFFDFDRSVIRSDGRDALMSNVRWLQSNPDVAVTIEGHCDERGSNEYNMALGHRRATAARDFLMAAGIALERITIISYGEERPFVIGHDESAWRWNRRAHFVAGTAPGPRVSTLR